MNEHHINQALDLLDRAAVYLFTREPDDVTLDVIGSTLMEARAHLVAQRPFEILDDRMAELTAAIPEPDLGESLPDIRPVTGLRTYRGKDVSCPKCKAKKGQLCLKMTIGRPNADGSLTPVGEPATSLHPERTHKAKLKANPQLAEVEQS